MYADPTNARIDDQHAESQRLAYNAAFDELGLSWSWDADTFARLPAGERQRVQAYLEREHPHLLRAYDADFLANAVESTKERCFAAMQAGRTQARGAAAVRSR
ncbi:hypothetical protein WG902_08375 [Ramlibacter sp. PS3R-8]|uniref:hypothetical protein n=1 Tax=Ramlibacter sp. PS3R-8 TaxID=3133437 RepID=UPI0030A86935